MVKVVALDFVGVLVKERNIELNKIEDKLERMYGDNTNDNDYLEMGRRITNDNLIDMTYNIFDKLYEPVDKDIFTKLKEKYNNIIFIVATNHVSYIRSYIEKTFKDIDDVVASAEIGKIKPNRDFYEYILNKFSINPDELLFFDDSSYNVEGALKLGIKAIKVNKDTNLYEEVINNISI